MPARLTIHFSDQPAKSIVAEEPGEYVIGRDPGCDIVLDDARISRRHARLTVSDGGGAIEDLESKNGLALNGEPVTAAALSDDCWLSVGGLLVQHEAGERALAADESDRLRRAATRHEHEALARAGLDVLAVVERLLGSFLQASGTERGFVLLGAQARFNVVSSRGVTPEAVARGDFSGSASTVRDVLKDGAARILSDVREDPASSGRPSVVRDEIRALVCVPLAAADRILGAVYADSRKPGKRFGELDVEILQALATHAALALWASGVKDQLEQLARGLPTKLDSGQTGLSPMPGFLPWAVDSNDRIGESAERRAR